MRGEGETTGAEGEGLLAGSVGDTAGTKDMACKVTREDGEVMSCSELELGSDTSSECLCMLVVTSDCGDP